MPRALSGHRHGSRPRTLMGTFGKVEIDVPRARLEGPDGKTTEWRSASQRRQASARKLKRAQILLAADAGASDEAIAISVSFGRDVNWRGAGGTLFWHTFHGSKIEPPV